MADKIRVTCPACGARFKVSDPQVRGRRFKARCKRCGGEIIAIGDEVSQVLSATHAAVDDHPELDHQLSDEHFLNDLSEEEPLWYLVISGQPAGPYTAQQIRTFFQEQRVNARSYLWRKGDPKWRHLEEIDDFRELAAAAGTALYEGSASKKPYRDVSSNADIQDPTSQFQPHQHLGRRPRPASAENIKYRGASAPAAIASSSSLSQSVISPETYEPLPAFPRRVAHLPAPTGKPRHPVALAWLKRRRGENFEDTSSAAIDLSPEIDDQVRPLSEEERREFLQQPANAAFASPTGKPAHLPSGLPAGKRPEDSLPNLMELLGPPPINGPIPEISTEPPSSKRGAAKREARQKLTGIDSRRARQTLIEELLNQERWRLFWTPGKIAVIGAIGGALLVLLAVIAFFMIAAPSKSKKVSSPPEETTTSEPNRVKLKTQKTEARPAAHPATKSAPRVKTEQKVTPLLEKIEEKKPEKKETKQAQEIKEPKLAKETKQSKEIKLAKETKQLKEAKQSKSIRSLKLDKPSKKKGGAKSSADVDDILAAGDTTSKTAAPTPAPSRAKPAKKSEVVDDILAAGTTTGGTAKPTKSSAAPSPAPAAAPEPSVPKTLTREQIQSTLRRVLPQVTSCYDRYKQSGIIRVSLTIKGNGTSESDVTGNFAGTPTAFCVLGAVSNARFPTFSGPPVKIVYPFKLE